MQNGIDMAEEEIVYPLDEERAQKAYESLVKYLALSARSEKECKNKLYDKGYHKNEVEYAIERAKKYKYIDDEEYVRTYLLFNKNRYGAKKIAYKLINEKGVDKNTVENVIADNIDEDFQVENAMKMAQKYIKQKKIVDKKDAQKVGAHLYQKGFDARIINKVITTLFDVFE